MKKLKLTPGQKGYLYSNLFALLAIGFGNLTFRYLNVHEGIMNGNSGTLIYSEFILVPLLMGIISAWYWRHLDLSSWTLIGRSCLNTLYAIILSVIFLGEGIICLFIVSPLIILFISFGALVGKAMFRSNNPNLNVSVISLIFFLMITDTLSKHSYENMVSDQIIVKATPDKIWKNVVAFERIKARNNYWLFKVGLPSPVESTVTGYYKGAGRKCIFSNGYTFDEVISTYNVSKDLIFDIIKQPRDPEIMGHLDLLRGQFLLKDNGDGTTTLTGNSWYRLYVFPAWYYDVWAKSIVRNVHLRVMAHIKELSEK